MLSKVKVFLDLYHQRVKLQEQNTDLQELSYQMHEMNNKLLGVTDELQEANLILSKRALQLEASNQVGQQVTSILALDELLAAVVEAIQTRFGYYFVGVWLLNEAKDQVSLQAGQGCDGSYPLAPGWIIKLDVAHSIVAWVAGSGQVYQTHDVSTDARFMVMDALPETRSEVALPLRLGQEIIGVLDIQSNHLAGFDNEDARVLQTLTNQIAIAIRNARLYEVEKQLNADKDKFFAIISHDLRNPFNVLLGNSQFMVETIDKLSQKDIVEISQSIYNQAKAAHNLLENLLTWSQLQRGRIDYTPNVLELRPLVEKTTNLLDKTAQTKQIRLEQTIAAGLCIYADEYMLDTVIRNLTCNALKFTPAGGQVTIAARFTPEHTNWVEVRVSDTGVGISPADIDKLFKLELHHTTPGTAQEKGTGLGLILCQEMVEKNGGKIWIESDGVPGQGVTVIFTVPLGSQPVGG